MDNTTSYMCIFNNKKETETELEITNITCYKYNTWIKAYNGFKNYIKDNDYPDKMLIIPINRFIPSFLHKPIVNYKIYNETISTKLVISPYISPNINIIDDKTK